MVGNLPRGRPVEAAAVDDDAADGDAVAAQELGGGMHDDVGTVLDGPAQVGRGERGIDRQRQAVPVGDARPPPRCPAPPSPGLPSVSANSSRVLSVMARCEAGGIARIDQRRGDAEARQGVHEHVVRAAVDARGRDDVPARTHQRGDDEMQRRLAAGGGDRADAALQRRDALLQHRHRRVGDARIDVPGALQVEQGGGVLGVVEHVGRGLVDRHRPRARGRVGPLAGVQGERVEAWSLAVWSWGSSHSATGFPSPLRGGQGWGSNVDAPSSPTRRFAHPPRKGEGRWTRIQCAMIASCSHVQPAEPSLDHLEHRDLHLVGKPRGRRHEDAAVEPVVAGRRAPRTPARCGSRPARDRRLRRATSAP